MTEDITINTLDATLVGIHTRTVTATMTGLGLNEEDGGTPETLDGTI